MSTNLISSHDDFLKEIDLSGSDKKEALKKALQDAYDLIGNYRRYGQVEGAKQAEKEYATLREKTLEELKGILDSSKSERMTILNAGAFENKEFTDMGKEELIRALAQLKERTQALPNTSYTTVKKGLSAYIPGKTQLKKGISILKEYTGSSEPTQTQSGPKSLGEIIDKTSAFAGSELIVKKLVGETGFNNEVIAGFDAKQGNYIANISDFEQSLKDTGRTISSGSEEQQLNSKLVANYLKYLNSSVGGNQVEFQKIFVNKFGEKKAKELVELWISGKNTNAIKELQSSGIGSIVENIKSFDINNIGQNFALLGLISENQITTLAGNLNMDGLEAGLLSALNDGKNKNLSGACIIAEKILDLKIPLKEQLEDIDALILDGVSKITEVIPGDIKGKKGQIIGKLSSKVKDIIQVARQSKNNRSILKAAILKLFQETLSSEDIQKIDVDDFAQLIVKVSAVDARRKLSNLRTIKDAKSAGVNKLNSEKTPTDSEIESARVLAEEATQGYNDFREGLIKINGVLTKRVTKITSDEMKEAILKNPEQWLGLLDIEPLLQIIPFLPKSAKFSMMAPATRSHTDVIKILAVFKNGLTDSEIRTELSSMVLFVDGRRNGNTEVNLELIKTLLNNFDTGKASDKKLKKTLVDRIYESAEVGSEVQIMKTLKNAFHLNVTDFPLYVLKKDTENTVFPEGEKKAFLEHGDHPNIDELIKKTLSGSEKISLFGANPISKINDYIELNGIKENIDPQDISKLIEKFGIDQFPAVYRFLSTDMSLAISAVKADIASIKYIPSYFYKNSPEFKQAFLDGYSSFQVSKKYSVEVVKKVLEKYEFTSLKELSNIYRVTKGNNTIFLDRSIQGQITNLLRELDKQKNESQESLNEDDMKALKNILKTVNSFASQITQIKEIHGKFLEKGEEIKGKFLEELKGVLKEFNISEKDGEKIIGILENPDWFEANLQEIITIFGNETNLENFIKKVKSLELESNKQRNALLSEKENIPPECIGKTDETLKQDFLKFLAKIPRNPQETQQAFQQRVLEQYLLSPENKDLKQESIVWMKMKLQTLLNMDQQTFIINNTSTAIRAQQEGRFADIYSSYLAQKYNIPEIATNVVGKTSTENKGNSTPFMVEENGNHFVLLSGKEKVEVTPKEFEIFQKSETARTNLKNFYERLESLGLEGLWKQRDKIIKGISNAQGKNLVVSDDKNFLSDEEQTKFFAYILKSIKPELEKEKISIGDIDPFKINLEQVLAIIRDKVKNTSSRAGETQSEKIIPFLFRKKFFEGGNLGHTFYSPKFEQALK